MILVLLGTQNNSFHRLLEKLESLIDSAIIKEDVVVQAGYTKFETNKMKIFDTVAKQDLEKLIEDANYVITHGGVGSMVTANQKGKKVIAVPRLKQYHEHVNDHQIDTVRAFKEKGYVLECQSVEKLHETIEKIAEFEPIIYQKTESRIIEIIENFIENN